MLNDVTVHEHITAHNNELLNKARKVMGENKAWSSNGKLFVSINGKKKQIPSDSDISTLPVQPAVAASENNSSAVKINSANKHQKNINYYNSSVKRTYPRSYSTCNHSSNNHYYQRCQPPNDTN